MVRDFQLKDCVGMQPQTAAEFRDNIIARIRELLATPSRHKVPCEDCITLRKILLLTEALQRNEGMEDAVLLQKLSEVARNQFSLQPETRRQLARVIPWLPTQWKLTPEVHGDVSNAWGKIVLATAQLKVLHYLEPLPEEDKSLLVVIDLISSEISKMKSRGIRRPRTHRNGNRNTKSQKFDARNKISRLCHDHQALTNAPSRQGKYDKNAHIMQIEQPRGMILPEPQFWVRFEKCIEMFKADYGNMVPSVLSVPKYRSVRYEACLKILEHGFLMPIQLLEKTKQLESDLGIYGAFESINKRIADYQQTLVALATEDTVTAHVFEHPEVLHDLHSEIEQTVCTFFKTKKCRPEKGNEVLPATKLPAEDGPKTDSKTDSQPLSEQHETAQKPLLCKKNDDENRQVTVSQWHFSTRLCDSALQTLFSNNMDAGTFPDVWHSAAYHVNKHAPEMLVEDYIGESQKLFRKCWIGQLEKRLVSRRLAVDVDQDENLAFWAKAVHCPMGDGCYSWQGRTIWYHPPKHKQRAGQ
ncbi:hypothetical protein QQS21_009582 [Conoideocrella luteorostrata]|uniref:Uncharacterized protein n=1 Tax=Conoideocrella luteorostrata TaxID=1105319 RepID=A0AAJ0FQ85_9HYPO|nr:hypothetical protein QQS21_009582 [Conoideocrella luteorostrata]